MDFHATIVSTVPEWFYRSSFSGTFTYHHVQTDVGPVQRTALQEDIPATVKALADFYPLRRDYIDRLAAIFSECNLILCDIAPAGIVAARKVGVPSVLLENFTWDWIYQGYGCCLTELQPYIDMFRELYRQADYHIQAVPICSPCRCDLRAGPIARRLQYTREAVRQKLELGSTRKAVLVSMGGGGIRGLDIQWPEDREVVFFLPWMKDSCPSSDHLRLLPAGGQLHHPDLVASCDAVIGKAGYSTLAEVYQAGVPFGYLRRPGFRESGPLVRFIEEQMAGLEITEQDLRRGGLHRFLPQLFRLQRSPPRRADGAKQCASFLADLLRKNRIQSPLPPGD